MSDVDNRRPTTNDRLSHHSSNSSRSDLATALAEIYAELAARVQEKTCSHCTECCRFAQTGRTPMLTAAEARVAAQAWKATGRKFCEKADGSSPCLDDSQGRCLIYATRPFGCRSHFCAASGGTPPRRDVADLIRRMEDLDTSFPAPRPLVDALNHFLRMKK